MIVLNFIVYGFLFSFVALLLYILSVTSFLYRVVRFSIDEEEVRAFRESLHPTLQRLYPFLVVRNNDPIRLNHEGTNLGFSRAVASVVIVIISASIFLLVLLNESRLEEIIPLIFFLILTIILLFRAWRFGHIMKVKNQV